MKKLCKKIISFVLAIMMSISIFVPVFANEEIGVFLDNEKIQFDVAPLLINGRTMVPMRSIFEKLGAVVYWDNDTRTAIAQKGDINVSIAIDDTTLYKNGQPIILDVPAQLFGGRTFIPLRAVSEAFDYEVLWNGDTQTVRILTFTSFLKNEASVKLISWVTANSNSYFEGRKQYEYQQGNYKLNITPNENGKSFTISYTEFKNDGTALVFINLLQKKFVASYKDAINDTYNISAGDIIKSSVSNSLELTCGGYEGNYAGNKNTLLGKYQDCVNIALKLFDSFLKANYIGLSLEDFEIYFDLSTVVLYNSQNNISTNNYQGSESYISNTNITLSSFPLYLYADDGTGTFLGEISSNKYDTDSIANEYGDYGSQYGTKSIFNQYSDYGSQYSRYSVFDKYATKPPKILDKNGKVVGYLTANKYIRDAISYEEMMVLLKKFNK